MVRNNIMKQSMGNWIALVYHQKMKRADSEKELDDLMKIFGRMCQEEKELSAALIREIESLDEFINKVESRLRDNPIYRKINLILNEMSDIELGLVNEGRSKLSELSSMLEQYYEERVEIKFDRDIQYYGYEGS